MILGKLFWESINTLDYVNGKQFEHLRGNYGLLKMGMTLLFLQVTIRSKSVRDTKLQRSKLLDLFLDGRTTTK